MLPRAGNPALASAACMFYTTCLYKLECSQIANFMAGNANIISLAEKRMRMYDNQNMKQFH
jgi:hypothetical protein